MSALARAISRSAERVRTRNRPYDTPVGERSINGRTLRAFGAGASLVRDWGFAGVAIKTTQDEYGLLPEDPSEPGGHIELEQTRIETRGDFRINVGPFDRTRLRPAAFGLRAHRVRRRRRRRHGVHERRV
jgi:hypothetical protein